MAFPIAPVSMPADLAGKTNGKLPDSLLSTVDGGGRLHHLAARAWGALVAAAWHEVGLPLTFTHGGTYRSYTAQETLFRSRYTPGGTGGGCKSWDSNGDGARESWCKKSSNLATAAVPGTSNHGWGLAIDSAWDKDLTDGLGPDDAAGITSHPGWSWLLANAARFGFSWELVSEPWHIRYVTGDTIPAEVLKFENPTQPPTEGDLIDMFRIRYRDSSYAPGAYTGLICNGPLLGWIGDGNADVALGKGGARIVDDLTTAELDGMIKTLQTTSQCPPEWVNTPRGAAWNARRG